MKAIYVAKSNIHGRGVFSVNDLNQNDIIGVSHVSYERVWYQVHPIGIFYNHSNNPTVIRMVSNILPTLNFGDPIDTKAKAKRFDENDTNRENMYYNLSEKPDAKYMFMVSVKDIKAGEELTANYNLYTYPKTGVGLQMF